jgi:hypothetical protein
MRSVTPGKVGNGEFGLELFTHRAVHHVVFGLPREHDDLRELSFKIMGEKILNWTHQTLLHDNVLSGFDVWVFDLSQSDTSHNYKEQMSYFL